MKNVRTFSVQFCISHDKLGTILSLLTSEVSKLEVKECDASVPAAPKRRVFKNRSKQGVFDVVLSELASGPKSSAELEEAMAAAGHARSSASPSISKLLQDGKVVRTANGACLA